MKIKTILVILAISALILFAGCAKKECSAKSDCISKGDCFITSCVKGKCIYTEKQGCTCGNLRCDGGENSCTCPADCGACAGNIGTLMQKSCVNNECVTSVKAAEQTTAEDTITKKEGSAVKLELALKTVYDQPFNIKKSLFSVDIGINKQYTGVTDIKITRIRLVQHSVEKDRYGKRTGDSPVVLVDRQYSKILFDENSEFVKEFPVFISSMETNSEATKDMTLEITYEYTSASQQTGTFEKDLEMVFVNPSQPVSCPSTCSDNNTCTTDTCGEQTNYFCEHEITSTGACCGDDACNLGEDKCRCPQDCGACSGDVGTYMMMGCSSENTCAYTIKNPAVVQQTSKLADATFGGKAQMSIKISYYTPFDRKNSRFTVVLEPKTLGGVIDFTISKVTVLDTAGTILGEISVSRQISEGTTGTVEVPLTYTTLSAEEEKTVRIRIDYSMKNPTSTPGVYTDIISYYQYDIGKLMILNPAS
jgi:hypothetical protein